MKELYIIGHLVNGSTKIHYEFTVVGSHLAAHTVATMNCRLDGRTYIQIKSTPLETFVDVARALGPVEA